MVAAATATKMSKAKEKETTTTVAKEETTTMVVELHLRHLRSCPHRGRIATVQLLQCATVFCSCRRSRSHHSVFDLTAATQCHDTNVRGYSSVGGGLTSPALGAVVPTLSGVASHPQPLGVVAPTLPKRQPHVSFLDLSFYPSEILSLFAPSICDLHGFVWAKGVQFFTVVGSGLTYL